ncbi:hypothetical protein [Dokdonia sp.]|uniref:hypothetical protein n=1 Tax=Dokdonia sp. TaxID=2024995 RepID=UPI00326620C2
MKKLFVCIAVLIGIVVLNSCNPRLNGHYTEIREGEVNPDIQSVMTYLQEQDYSNPKNPNWHLFPGTDVSSGSDTLKRLGLAVHGRWIRTYVNDIANEFLKLAVDSTITQPLDFPPGSFIVKQNYHAKIDSTHTENPLLKAPGAITLLYKPYPKYNYCATATLETYNGVDCYGGDWFYGFFFEKDVKTSNISAGSQGIQNHVSSFCVNCHAPAFNTDYVRTLDDIRNPFSEQSDTPYCDRFITPPDMNGSSIITQEPTDLAKFSETVEAYVQDSKLSPKLPSDVPVDPTLAFKYLSPEKTQEMFNSYGWKSFIALNWPNKKNTPTPQRGEADTSLPFTGNSKNSTVWETYKPTFEVFQPGNISWDPVAQPWNQKPPVIVEASCKEVPHDFVITMESKTRDVLNETGQAFAGTFGYLVDQDRKKVRYEVLFNRTEFEYLISNGRAASLNLTPSGPKGEVNTVNFPDTKADTLYNEGAMEVKSAWKELVFTENNPQKEAEELKEANEKFFVRKALIYDSEKKACRVSYMALVGLHIARKTYFAPQWIWITFEHKDNAPDAGDKDGKGTFYNPDLPSLTDCDEYPFLAGVSGIEGCPNVDLNRFDKGLKDAPNQITRLVPLTPEAIKLNTMFQAELKKIGSPFANYILVNVQWPLNGRNQNGTVNKINCKDNTIGNDCFSARPRFLRNTVIESFMTTYCDDENGKATQRSNRSCMTCHGAAGADLSYIWLDAVSQRVKIE